MRRALGQRARRAARLVASLAGVAALVVLVAGTSAVAGIAGPAGSPGGGRAAPPAPVVQYQPPVLAPVVDPYRPPATRYGPGNRGIEYATAPGTVVVAAAGGRVTFAGRVAGSLDVTILHADGVRTSYVGLATTGVRVGDRVAGGARIGTTGTRLHIGARLGDDYLDPASLWGAASRAVLVPLDGL